MLCPPEVAMFSDSGRLIVRHASFSHDHWQRSRPHIPLDSRSWQAAIVCGYGQMYLARFSGPGDSLHRQVRGCLSSLDEQGYLPLRKGKLIASFFLLPVHSGSVDPSRSRCVLVPTMIGQAPVPTRESASGTRNRPQWDSVTVLVALLHS